MCKVGKNNVGAGAADGKKGFIPGFLKIEPALLGGGMDLGVLPGNLVSRDWQARGFPKVTENVQIRSGRFHHEGIGSFLLVEQGVAQDGTSVGRIGLVGALVERAGAGRLGATDGIPERTVKRGGELGGVRKNAGGDGSGGVRELS